MLYAEEIRGSRRESRRAAVEAATEAANRQPDNQTDFSRHFEMFKDEIILEQTKTFQEFFKNFIKMYKMLQISRFNFKSSKTFQEF